MILHLMFSITPNKYTISANFMTIFHNCRWAAHLVQLPMESIRMGLYATIHRELKKNYFGAYIFRQIFACTSYKTQAMVSTTQMHSTHNLCEHNNRRRFLTTTMRMQNIFRAFERNYIISWIYIDISMMISLFTSSIESESSELWTEYLMFFGKHSEKRRKMLIWSYCYIAVAIARCYYTLFGILFSLCL